MPLWLPSVADQFWTGFLDLLPTIITVWAGFKLITHRQEVERRDRIADDRDSRIRALIAEILQLADPMQDPSAERRVDAKVAELRLFLNPSGPVEADVSARGQTLVNTQRQAITAHELLLMVKPQQPGNPTTKEIDTWFEFANRDQDRASEFNAAFREFSEAALTWSQFSFGAARQRRPAWLRIGARIASGCRLLLTRAKAWIARLLARFSPQG